MSAPRWARALLRRLAPPERVDDLLGDLEEAHRERVARRAVAGRRGMPGRRDRLLASVATGFEALELAVALVRARNRGNRESRMTARVSWLDFKPGIRMLVKYPGLTMVGGLALAFAIGVGAGMFEFATQLFNPTLPLPDGDRIVGIQIRDVAAGRVEPRVLHDFVAWREGLETVDDLGAYRTLERSLVTERGGEPVEVAAISASAFRVARLPPLLGRTLVEADERPGAPPVVVVGYDIWQRSFDGDPDVVGRTGRVGSEQATVVGVMPKASRSR